VTPAPDPPAEPPGDGDARPIRAALEPEALLDALIGQSAVGITIVDRDLRIVRANRVFGVFGDQTQAEVYGRTIDEVLPHLAPQIVPATVRVLETGEPAVAAEVVARDPDDPENTRYFRTFRGPVVSTDGEIVGVTSTVIEITDLRKTQIERDDALARYRTIFDGASIGIVRADRTGRVIEANPAMEQMLGYTAAELAAMRFQEYTHPDDVEQNIRLFNEIMEGHREAYRFEKRCFRKNGQMIWLRVTSVAEVDEDGRRTHATTMLEDVTERKLAEQAHLEQARLNEHYALHDALTGLANRRKLYADVEQALNLPEEGSFALGLYDLDGVKADNDAFGHPAGDALLARLGRRIADAMSGRGTVYRMGGDEFCVFTWAADSERVLEDARLALSDKGEGFVIRCSCGVALVPTEAATLERAIQIADERLYKDKRANRITDTLQVRDALVQLIAEQRQELAPNTVNVADLAAATATRLGLSAEEIACTRIAAELHDIGKTAMPEAILSKTGPLDQDERIVAAAPALARIAPIVRASHERPDGHGYPDGLTTDAIPIGARIVAVVDAFDAMVSARPYRPAMSISEAVAELRRCAGTQFDATVVDAFGRVIEQPRREYRAA
jgi:PAS domain S-box-containing protein/diguanylate cyclase (GGDEF)-like protein